MHNNDTIALSSRVRLARNVAGIPFAGRMQRADLDKICSLAAEAFSGADYEIIPIENLLAAQKRSYIERHLASPALMESGTGMLILSRDQTIAIMVSEEDHFRIQCIFPGQSLGKAQEMAAAVNTLLEQDICFAFDESLGYLTACPTNVGTGMRASVMMHLPSLTMTGQMGKLQKTLQNNGMTVRGIYGEGSNAIGSIFQISNRVTLGASEQQLTEGVGRTVSEIARMEQDTCNILKEAAPISVEDGVFRAYGTLAYARSIDLNEFMRLWSSVMMGCALGWIKLDADVMKELLTEAQPGQLAMKYGAGNIDVARAQLCQGAMARAGFGSTEDNK